MALMANVLNWLTQPKGPHLVDGTLTLDSSTALAILVTSEALYDPDSPRVGLGLIYKAPYIQAASFSEAYFFLKSASRAEASNWTTSALIIFVQIHDSSQVIPLPGVPTLFLDVKTAEDVTDSNEPRPPQDFRSFRLHRVIYVGAGPPVGQVAFPCLQGKTVSHWAPTQRQVMTPELEEMPQLSVALSAADVYHWNIGNDPIFPSCLDKFRARHEASQASGATKLTRRHGSHGESSTPTHELPFPAWPQPPSTPTLGWHEVDEKVTEVMDQLHNLHLETVQEMGFIWAVDRTLAKSIMVPQAQTHHRRQPEYNLTDMACRHGGHHKGIPKGFGLSSLDQHNSSLQEYCSRGGSPQVPRGSQAEAGSPTDSTGCSPRGDGEIHSVLSRGAAVSAGDKASGHGAFLKDYRPSKQGTPGVAQ